MHKTAVEGSMTSTLEKIISTVGELPASPAIVSVVMGLTSNLDSKLGDVTRVLSSDQSLTAKVLKLSNSALADQGALSLERNLFKQAWEKQNPGKSKLR